MTLAAPYLELLRRNGFGLFCRLDYRMSLTAWWNAAPDARMQVLVVLLGETVLLKADKSYFMASATEAGQTWARDLPALHDWLETHLPEVRIAFSHFRDVPASLAAREVQRQTQRRRETEPPPTPQRLAELQEQLRRRQFNHQADLNLAGLAGGASDALSDYLHARSRRDRSEIDALQEQVQRYHRDLDLLEHLQHEYRRKGSAAVYTFAVHSGLQVAYNEDEFEAALAAIMREIRDQHRYQITQKLQGGRLNIQLAECTEPAIAWIEQWLGGTLSPTQLARIEQNILPAALVQDHVMVVPDEPIPSANGHVQADAKHIGARVLSTMIGRLNQAESEAQRRTIANNEAASVRMPLHVGLLVDKTGRELEPAVLALEQIVHAAVSGTTGSGKSYLARVLVEEAAMIPDLGVLVLDPRSQFTGLLVPEDRPAILSQYAAFGMDALPPRGFDFAYYAPALPDAALPDNLAALASGHAIVSCKGMDDAQRCAVAADVLIGVFDALARQGESEHPGLLIVVDEAHLFTRKRILDEAALSAAARSEAAIDRLVREGRKYGIVMILVSQSMKDFSRDLASVRQMTSTKIFMRNSDNEVDYAAAFLGDGRPLVNLPTGVAIVHNAAWGAWRLRIRPPLSKVCELDEARLRQLLSKPLLRRENALSPDARTLLLALREQCRVTGPINMSQAAQLTGITSKRRLQAVVSELEQTGLLASRKLPERGSPRLIEPAIEPPADCVRPPDETPT